MKKTFSKTLAIFVSVVLCLPVLCAFPAYAADDDIWSTLTPAYMKAGYTSIEERIYADGVDGVIASMELMFVDEANGYAQYIDKNTGEFVCLKLQDKVDGAYPVDENGVYKYSGYWSTNPYNIGTSAVNGVSSSESIKKQLYSQVIIDFTENDIAETFYSFNESALYNQINVSKIRGGTRVEYAIGREEIRYLVPRCVSAPKWQAIYDAIVAGLGEYYGGLFAALYTTMDLDDDTVIQTTKDYWLEQYPSLATLRKIYVCTSDITEGELSRLEEYVTKNTDYSFEQLDEDHAETGYVSTDKAPPLFKLAIEYTIDDHGLVVRCAAGNVRFDSSAFKLSNITFLPYAGAGNTNNEGYALIPDGSGSIVEFEDAKGSSFSSTDVVYGQDYTFSTIGGANKEVTRLPVFGVVEEEGKDTTSIELVTKVDENGDEYEALEEVTVHTTQRRGYMTYVEEGDALANITVQSGGTSHMFLQTYTSFNPRPKDSYLLSGGISAGTNAMWTVESKRKYTKFYKLRVFILDEEDASYVGMAKILREYLLETGVIVENNYEGDIPLFLETLGAMDTTKRILGVPIDTTVALSAFDDTIDDVLVRLKNENINNIVLKLTGWANGGMVSTVPSGVEIEDALGGSSGFKKLVSYCKENGVGLFPDFDFVFAHDDKWFDGFGSDDYAKTIDDRNAIKKEYDPVYQAYKYSKLGVISANVMMNFYDKTYADYKKYDVGGIAVSTLGDFLNSDFNEDDPLNREDSKTLTVKLLDKIKQENGKVLLSGGNAYTLKYADYILDVPLEDSMLRYSSASVPFLSMVLHGYIEYAGTALNLAGDYQHAVLKTLENGANPYFVIALDNTALLKNDPELSQYYSVRYSIWLQDIYNTYVTLNNALKGVRNSVITDHQFLDADNNVVKVVYDNGTTFYINYNLTDYTAVDGESTFVIPAEDFIMLDASGNVVE